MSGSGRGLPATLMSRGCVKSYCVCPRATFAKSEEQENGLGRGHEKLLSHVGHVTPYTVPSLLFREACRKRASFVSQ